MSALLFLSIASMAVQGYSLYTWAEQAEEMAKLRKEDISLQRESMKLSEEARKFKEELAEAKARKDMRRAQSIRLARSAVSGTDYSSANIAMREGITAEFESGITTQKELSGIATEQAQIQQDRFSVAERMIQEPSTLDQILGYAGIGISSGLLLTQTPEFKARTAPKYTTDYSIPMTATDLT